MHRTALAALTAALALLAAAPSVPGEPGKADTTASTVRTVASPARVVPVVVPVQHAEKSRACRSGLVALTFDDGPSKSVTPGLLHTLISYDVPATFFMVGFRVKAAPHLSRRIAEEGFVIGNHTWDHRQLTALSKHEIKHELRSTGRAMRSGHVPHGRLMRPPYGAINGRVSKVVRGVGLVPVLWTIDSADWSGGSPIQIASRVLKGLRAHKKNLVLLHDGVTNSPNTAKAVPIIIRKARERGYCFAEVGPDGGVAVPVPALRATVVPGTEDGPTPLRVRLDLDRVTSRTVSVRVRTADGSADAGKDYTASVARVTFPRGVRTAWFLVPVRTDTTAESVEDVQLLFDQPRGLRLNRTQVLGSIFSSS